MAQVSALVFSKDRAFQLHECLRTLQRFCTTPVRAHVLFKASSDALAESYASVARGFPWATLERETDLAAQVRAAAAAAEDGFLMTLVDDVLFVDSLDLDGAAGLLADSEELLAVHLRLHPHVTRCHPAGGRQARVPPLRAAGRAGFWTFARAEGTRDWNYPWDLCCSLYRAADVQRLVAELPDAALAHPNRFEVEGNKALARLSGGGAQLCACPRRPVLRVLTVNRVQDVYENPVYDTADGVGADLAALDALLRAGARLDEDAVREEFGASVHVGSFPVVSPPPPPPPGTTEEGGASPAADEPTEVSVLLPVFNARHFLQEALDSVARQTLTAWELVAVDDASTDDSLAILRAFAAQQPAGRVTVLALERNGGVAAALNRGLAACAGEFVARMDADDVMLPHRLEKQVRLLRRQPGAAGVGGCVESFFDDGSRARVVQPPCPPPLVRWQLTFSCVLTHPAMVLRRAALQAAGGYSADPAHAHVEDYELWLRLLRAGHALGNLDVVVLRLRRHAGSVSSAHRQAQAAAALRVAREHVEAALGRAVDEGAVRAARTSEPASAAEMHAAIDLLEGMLAWAAPDSPTARDDCRNRVGALATVGMSQLGDGSGMGRWVGMGGSLASLV